MVDDPGAQPLTLNPALNRIVHLSEHIIALHFAVAVVTSDKDFEGPGRYLGDGFPIPYKGTIIGLAVYDGTNVQSVTGGTATFSKDDRVSVFADYDAPWFDVFVQKNGVSTSVFVSQVLANTDLAATVFLEINLPVT